jgi:hypothetical protein
MHPRRFLKPLALVVGAMLFSIGIQAFAAFTQPAGAPPTLDAYAPLTTSNAGESKVAGLLLNCGTGASCAANGSSAIYGLLVPNGSVGIGNLTPLYKLDVAGDINFTGTLRQNGTAFGGASQWTTSGSNIYYNTGSVGIGTASPDRKLTIADIAGSEGTNRKMLYIKQPNDYGYSFNLDDAVTGRLYIMGVNNGVESNLLTLDRGGSVGIGTASPGTLGEKLTVAGSLVVNPGDVIALNNAGNPGLYAGDAFSAGNYGGVQWNSAGDYLSLMTNTGGAGLSLLESGNVGVGTAAPAAKLDVAGVIRTTDVAPTPASGAGLEFAYWPAGGQSNILSFDRTAAAYKKLSLDASAIYLVPFSGGNVGIGTASPSTKLQVGAKVTDDSGFAYDTNTTYLVHQTPTSAATLNDPKTVLMLARQGTSGQAFGAAAAFNLSRFENVGVNSRTRLDISLANASFDPTSNTVMTLLSSGKVGIGVTNPVDTLVVAGNVTSQSSGSQGFSMRDASGYRRL